MRVSRRLIVGLAFLFSLPVFAQMDKIVIPAGTPEDQALSAITAEPDEAKKLPMYEDFIQKFASNPAAVAYGNWQLSQAYDATGDTQKAIAYGDKALAGSPKDMDILVSQVNILQKVKDHAKIVEYGTRGGEVYNSLDKQPKPADINDADFAARVESDKSSAKPSYEFLEAAAYNAIAEETDARARMSYIEKFTPAFPNSRFGDGITSYAMAALVDLKDMNRLVAYGEKTLATNPNHVPSLLLLAGAYVDDAKPGSLAKSVTYAQRAIAAAKADAPDADNARKISAGVAHSTLGYAYMKQDKTPASVPELKSATALLRGMDEQQFAIAAYRLGYAYGKLNRMAEAREILQEAIKIQGPVQQMSKDLLAKVSTTKTAAK
jgi:tetratricopeptide (TPR) repeat protein